MAAMGWATDDGISLAAATSSDASPPQASSTLSAPGGVAGCPGPRLADGGASIEVQQSIEETHARDPVDHAVVDLEDERPLSARETLDEPCLPQRPLTIQRL